MSCIERLLSFSDDALQRAISEFRGGHVCLHTKLVEQCLGLFEIERVEALGEPPVDWREQRAGLSVLALVVPEPSKAGGGAQLPRLSLLGPSNLRRLKKAGLSSELVTA